MLKNFVSSMLAILLLAGCGGSGGSQSGETQSTETAVSCAEMAQTLVNELDMADVVTEAKTRIVYGSFFNAREGDEGLPVSDAAAFVPAEKNSDQVAVFRTDDADTVKNLLNDYLSAQKALSEMYSPEEVFKISNAVIDTSNDGSVVVLIVCNDIEKAKTAAASVLGK